MRTKDLVAQLERANADAAARDSEHERLLADAVLLARTFKGTAEKLLDAIRSSSLASSLSLQSLTAAAAATVEEPLAASSTSSLGISTSAGAQATRRELEAIGRFDVRSFEEVILKSFKLVKKWQLKATECV